MLLRLQTARLSAGERHLVQIHVDLETLCHTDDGAERCHLEDGPALCRDIARRLACDGGLVALFEDADGRTLDVGRKTGWLLGFRGSIAPSMCSSELGAGHGAQQTGAGLPGGARSPPSHHPATVVLSLTTRREEIPMSASRQHEGEAGEMALTDEELDGVVGGVALDRCFVKSWSTSGDADDRPTEEVAFYYNKIASRY